MLLRSITQHVKDQNWFAVGIVVANIYVWLDNINNKKNMRKTLSTALVLTPLIVACETSTSLPDPLAAGWQGKPVCETLHEDVKQRVLRCTFEPNTGHERHYHDPYFGYTLEGGKGRLTDENGVREVNLVKGDSIASPGTAWHEVMNIGDTTIVYLIVEPK